MSDQIVNHNKNLKPKRPDAPILMYLLMITSVIVGLTGLIAVAWAYYERIDSEEDWVKTHYTFIIRTFWIFIAIVLLGAVVGPIAYIVYTAGAVWVVIRCVKGLTVIKDVQAIYNPETWLFETREKKKKPKHDTAMGKPQDKPVKTSKKPGSKTKKKPEE